MRVFSHREKVVQQALSPSSGSDSSLSRLGGSEYPPLSPFVHIAAFGAILVFVLAVHFPLLRLPYIWDEAGYYVPAARDLFHSGSLIPYSTVSNAHPPLVMAWLAAAWKVAGFQPTTTRVAMLLIAAFTLMGVFRLAARVANIEVAIASTISTAIYPVFFAQSSLAHLDLAVAGFTLWGLRSYLDGQRWATILWFSAAALTKETGIIAPLALAVWVLFCRRIPWLKRCEFQERHSAPRTVVLLAPALPLATWFAFHYIHTGHVFGNPEFFRYNVTATLHPLRIALATALRIWQVTGYMNLWLLTAAGLAALFLPPLGDAQRDRPRIPIPTQSVFLVLIGSYALTMATVGGAVLARYMLPVLPLVITLWISTLWRRVPYWHFVLLIVCFAFIASWFVNPPYSFPFEDNLAYRDYALLHQQAEQFLARYRPGVTVLTAWPASDELTRPYLGYVHSACRVVRIDDFSLEQVMSAADAGSQFDVALVFSTKYEPANPLLNRWSVWERIKSEYFGFHRDLPPSAISQVLGGDVIYQATRNGQWIAVIEIRRALEASVSNPASPHPASR